MLELVVACTCINNIYSCASQSYAQILSLFALEYVGSCVKIIFACINNISSCASQS